MNLVTGAPVWLAGLLVLTLIAGVIEDVARLRISNVTSAAILVEAVIAIAFEGISPGLWQNVVALACVLAVGTFLFSAGLLGGGDVKLFAALAFWLDLQHVLWLVAAVFIAGGVVALVYIGAGLATWAVRGIRRKDRRIPYGIAIAAGALFVFSFQRPEIAGSPRPLPAIRIVHSAR